MGAAPRRVGAVGFMIFRFSENADFEIKQRLPGESQKTQKAKNG